MLIFSLLNPLGPEGNLEYRTAIFDFKLTKLLMYEF